jgi:hypothetical protein
MLREIGREFEMRVRLGATRVGGAFAVCSRAATALDPPHVRINDAR